jgi:enamine deaminase RidA (YjgF/YER057c/UK114 family)
VPKTIVQPSGLPDPSATRAYSHGVRAGNWLFLAGQTGHDAPPLAGAGRFETQTRRTFERMRMILGAAGVPITVSVGMLDEPPVVAKLVAHIPDFIANALAKKRELP